MKKSVIFLINGLGIEKPGSYSISIDQCMPNLARTKETSFYTTAVISSLEYRSAYRSFFLGDTYKLELKYIKENIINDELKNNMVYQSLANNLKVAGAKLHVFIEPVNDKVVEQINDLVNMLNLEKEKEVYLHLILPQQTVNEYKKLITIINYIKYHINSHITVGFVIGKEYLSPELNKDEKDIMKKLFFYCSAERWSETDKKLLSLQESNVRPCEAQGFCATNSCAIANNDVIMFFNTNRNNYDNFLHAIYDNAKDVFKTEQFNLPTYSLIRLDSKYNINYLAENIVYENSLATVMHEAKKKALIIAPENNISLINFLANGLNYVNNPDISFMKFDYNSLNNFANVNNIINNTMYDLIIFDYHMNVSGTINDLKEGLEAIDKLIGHVSEACVNRNSLFITSLYGIKKTLPIANYNTEMVTIDYEMEIPIFFFDYSYLRSKYILLPGETNDILKTAIRCIYDNEDIYSLIKLKGFFNNLFGKK